MKIAYREVVDRTKERGQATFLPEPEPHPIWSPVISVDDHVIEPLSIFESRVPSRLREAVPQVVYQDEVPYWVIDDVGYYFATPDGAAGRPIAEWSAAPQKFEEFRRGTWDSGARLHDMDLAGIWASVCFPSTIWGFVGRRLSMMRDQDAAFATIRAYNDWMFEEWCGVAPDRYIPCQLPWLNDPVLAAEEIRLNAERGFHSVSFTENPEHLGLPSIHTPHWDPFFRACEETETVVNLHVGGSGTVHQPSSDSPSDVRVALFPVNGIVAVVDWIYSRVPLRFPNLMVVLSEAGVSWMPMVVERLARAYRQTDISSAWSATDPDPTDILRRNFYFTSIEDPSAMRLLDVIGEDNVMAEVDYPHADSTWPRSQEVFQSEMQHLPHDAVRKICFENAARVYRHPEPPASMLASSILFGASVASEFKR